MRSALVLVLACACHPAASAETPRSSAAPSTEASTGASAAPAEQLDLNLPGLDPDPAYPLDTAQPPVVYPLPDGRAFVHDGHHDRIGVRDRQTGKVTDLGEVTLIAAPRLGWLIVPKTSGPLQIHDVDPKAAKLRLLWSAPAVSSAEELTLSALAGVDRGAPLFMLRRVRAQQGGSVAPEAAVQLVRVRGPGQADVRSLPLPAELQVPGADAVRGKDLLLIEAPPRRDGGDDKYKYGQPFTSKVFALDLESGQLRPLGEANGDWSDYTAISHPYVAVRWSDHDRRVRDIWFGPECVNTVDVATVKLSPCAPKKR